MENPVVFKISSDDEEKVTSLDRIEVENLSQEEEFYPGDLEELFIRDEDSKITHQITPVLTKFNLEGEVWFVFDGVPEKHVEAFKNGTLYVSFA